MPHQYNVIIIEESTRGGSMSFRELERMFSEPCLFADDIDLRKSTKDMTGGAVGTRQTDNSALRKYSKDMVMDERYRMMPAAVVFPRSAGEVSALMKWANAGCVPVTPRGAGSGLAGAAIPVSGGVVCCFEKMNKIIEIDRENMMATVEPGVVTNELDRILEPHGLFFAGYPMSEDICHIGGNVAENAGGGRAVKYGVTSAYVIGAEVVSPTGDVLELGGKHVKDVTAYNLLQLLVGSEGTLGLFTKIVLRLVPRPQARVAVLAGFNSAGQAARSVAELRHQTVPSAIEFIDGETARRTRESIPSARGREIARDQAALLLVEYDGKNREELTVQKEQLCAILRKMGGSIVDVGDSPESFGRIWALRKAVPWWTKKEGGQYLSLEDVVVPPAAVPELVAFVDGLRGTFCLPIALFGHAGDGNFHITPMKPADMTVDRWRDIETELLDMLYTRVVGLGGTISGEHGIGRKRAQFLGTALSPAVIAAMRSLKTALDPNNVLNPGVIFPA